MNDDHERAASSFADLSLAPIVSRRFCIILQQCQSLCRVCCSLLKSPSAFARIYARKLPPLTVMNALTAALCSTSLLPLNYEITLSHLTVPGLPHADVSVFHVFSPALLPWYDMHHFYWPCAGSEMRLDATYIPPATIARQLMRAIVHVQGASADPSLFDASDSVPGCSDRCTGGTRRTHSILLRIDVIPSAPSSHSHVPCLRPSACTISSAVACAVSSSADISRLNDTHTPLTLQEAIHECLLLRTLGYDTPLPVACYAPCAPSSSPLCDAGASSPPVYLSLDDVPDEHTHALSSARIELIPSAPSSHSHVPCLRPSARSILSVLACALSSSADLSRLSDTHTETTAHSATQTPLTSRRLRGDTSVSCASSASAPPSFISSG